MGKGAMPRDAAFMQRTLQNYHAMAARFGERRWKTGRLAGSVRTVGRELPFSLDEYRDWVIQKLGGRPDGTCKCRYCPTIMTALDFGADHVEPAAQGGSLGLENLDGCCKPCNVYKGKLTEKGFLALKRWLDAEVGRSLSLADVTDIEKRLKGGGASYKSKFFKGRSGMPKPPPIRESQLPLEEPF